MTALFKTPKVPAPQIIPAPQVPTIDTAQQNLNEMDRLRRRRGLKGNIYAGLGMAVPTAPQKTLTGQ